MRIDTQAQTLDLNRYECEQSLYEFLRCAWRYIDPAEWRDGWHMAAIAEHLEAVVDGQVRNLIINMPPRHCKSILLSVAFLAWVWAQPRRGPISGPGVPFLYASYADKLSLRDSVKCRRLIESPWYQTRWGSRFALTSDQNTKSRFTNDQGGERLITSIGAGVTGEGGNCIVIDDPNAANDLESEVTMAATIEWWTTAMPTRLNDPDTGAFIIIQQRLAQDDLTGHIQENELAGWTQLILPGRYEPERSYFTTIGWKDPRTEPGQLLWPERFSKDSVDALERKMGPWKFAGQIQQLPSPKGGGVIKREWWQLWDKAEWPDVDFVLASLDTAYTTKTVNDYSALTVWGIFSSDSVAHANRYVDAEGRPMFREREYSPVAPKVILMDAWRDHLELNQLVERAAKTCKKFRVDLLLIENKAAGISVAQEIRRLYYSEKFGVQLCDPKSQDKLSRLYSVQHLFSEGIIHAPDRKWADMVITEAELFPKSKHDDLTDTVSQALRHLRDNGLISRAPERLAELESMVTYPGKQNEPLYPA